MENKLFKAAGLVMGLGFFLALSGSAIAEKKKYVLTPAELAEKETRKACKIQICSIFVTKKTAGEKIACDIKKTWREEDVKDMVSGGKIGWRWGGVFCTFDLKLDQAELAKTVATPGHELKIVPHTINCKVDRKKDGAVHEISIDIAPVVKFKDGKAVEGRMNWGKVEAPLLFKSLIWPGVKLDNKVNVIGGKLVNMVNGFIGVKCPQIASELPK